MRETEQLHGSRELPHHTMWQPLDSDIISEEADSHTILSLFERQVKAHPEKTAVIFRDRELTYGQLDQCATALGQKLSTMGVGPEDRVAILAERSLEMVVGVYGVLKAGGAYVPIDAAYPPERISYILEDAAPKAVLLYGADFSTSIPKMDIADALDLRPMDMPLPKGKAEDLAYLIYTSGTSGKPKGVMIEHRNVVNYSLQNGEGVFRYLPCGTPETIVSLTNFVFDIFVTELLVAPMLGMTVVLADDEEQVDSGALLDLMGRHPAAIMQTTPSRVQLYLSQNRGEEALRTFSYMMLGGEAVSPQLVHRLHRINPEARIVDVYGPSETTVWSTCADVTQGAVTIGTPITNTQVYILDGMTPCNVGVPGELCIGGKGVARGYLNRPDLTAEKFIPDPFGAGRIYRTGDLAQWREDGNLEFLGRIDDQVKIRGTRIELGEIDAVLREIPGVKDCAVIAREDGSGQKELFAFVTSEETLDLHRVRQMMSAFLPESMLPAYFAQIERIPLNSNGKLDKRALPEDVQRLSRSYVAPVSDHEKMLCRLFEEILDIERVGIHDHFFQLGGHSFRTIRLRNRIEEAFGCNLGQGEIFANPTPYSLALLLEQTAGDDRIAMEPHPALTYLPTSPSQRGLFYDNRVREDDYSYHLIGIYSLDKTLSVDRFREAFRRLICRHEILRTVFVMERETPYQRILPYAEADLTVVEDLDTEAEELVHQWITPFDLERGPLIRGRLVRREAEWLFLLDLHHIICDGIGRELILREISELYEGNVLPAPTYQYKDYCIWLSQQELTEQRSYWLSQYQTLPPPLELPTDGQRSLSGGRRGDMISMPLTEKLSRDISAFSKKFGASEYMVFLSAAFILLSRHSGSEDLVIGSAFSGRTNSQSEQMPGMFVNTLPLRGRPGEDKPYLTFLEEVKELAFQGQENQEFSFDALVQELLIRRDPGRNPLFDVMLVMQNGEKTEYGKGTLGLRPVRELYLGATFDMTFNIEEEDGVYSLSLQYSQDLFTEATAELYLQHYRTLLENMIRKPGVRIGELSCISCEEEARLRSFRGTEAPYDDGATISQLFEEQAKKRPDAIAIVCEETSLTYGELNRKANALANRLRQMGVGPEVPVALLLPQSPERFIGIYGVLKAGGFYIPIDPDYPSERIQYILSDSGAKVLITVGSACQWNIPTVDPEEEGLLDGEYPDLPHLAGPRNLAYCIYTSGTTGKPKGVMVEHQGVSNLKSYFESTLGITSEDGILQFANYVFDGSVWEMNMALLTGARLILVLDRMDPEKISATMAREGVTVASFPPNLYAQLKDISPRILVTAGSASDRGIVEKASDCRYVNSYGPTECTVAVTHWEGAMEHHFVPIGKPIPNKAVYILRGDRLCGIGVPGEICVAGVGIARGYLGCEELTRQRFVSNPFGDGVLYRTGDMGMMMPDGNIRFLGRVDDQVKIRGYRVEPGEVEACLRELQGIRDCTVVVGQDHQGENVLLAYVVGEEECSFDRLRRELKKTLPDYMIPSYFMELEEIPVTVNGKVDKRALPPITIRSDSEYIPPRNPREKLLVEALEGILQLSSISVKDNFFEMGGDSIKAMRVVSYLRERNMTLAVRDLMESDTIEEMTLYMDELLSNTYDQSEVCGLVTDTPMLRMFRHWNLPRPSYFYQGVLLSMDVEEGALRYALNAVTAYHDMLRGVYRDGQLTILPYREDSHFELRSFTVPADADSAKWIADTCSRIQSTMDLENGPLIKACIFRVGREVQVMLAVHHLLIDSVSWHILLEDLQKAVEGYGSDKGLELPLKTASFQQWAEALEAYAYSSALEKEIPYWKTVSEGIWDSKLLLKGNGTGEGKSVQIALTPTETEQLLTEACNTYHTQIKDLLLAALALAVREYTGQGQIAICMEGHGREPIHVPLDIDRTIGWFTCAYPVILKCTDDIAESIIETKELLRRIPNHGIGFGLLHDPTELDPVDIYFNYIGNSEESDNVGATSAEENAVGGPININGVIYNGSLCFSVAPGRGWTPAIDVSELGQLYHKSLLRVLDHCISSEESYMTYGDVDADDLEEADFDEISALLGL